MDQFVRRIGDVTIERVLPKGKAPSFGKDITISEAKKRPLEDKDDYREGLSVSKDLKIFIKQPSGAVDQEASSKEVDLLNASKSIRELRERVENLGESEGRASDDGDITEDSEDESEGYNDDNSDSENETLSQLKVRCADSKAASVPVSDPPADGEGTRVRDSGGDVGETVGDTEVVAPEGEPPPDGGGDASGGEGDAGARAVSDNSDGGGQAGSQRTDDDDTGRAPDEVGERQRGADVADDDAVVETPDNDGVAGTEEADDGGEPKEEDEEKKESEVVEETSKRKSQSDSGGDSSSGRRKRKKRRSGESVKSGGGSKSGLSSSSGSDDDSGGSGSDNKTKVERKLTNMRRNIREVMSENQLDEETLAAQRREMERLRRVQDQQRILREVQRQMALNKQNHKTQTRVISLLQGNSSLLKQIPGTSTSSSSQVRLPNTVLVKLAPSGANATQPGNKKVIELLRVQKGANAAGRGGIRPACATRALLTKQTARPGAPLHMMTPSVSIAPVPHMRDADSSDDEDEAARAALRKVAGKPKTKGKVQYDSNGAVIPNSSDVVTISSSSEDDCILLSEPSSSDEADAGDDPTNSGMHTNDLFNVPDEQGRVLVNVGHPPEEEDVFLAPQIARIIKPHQIGGIRFLYDNVVESIERFKTSTGFGCILAHSMGLGKTLQLVSFCDIFLRHTPARTVLCILPINTVQNWLAEFNMWLPAESPQSPLPPGELRPRNFALHVLNDSHKSLTARSKVIQDWSKDGGVLLMGYELYRQFSLKRSHRSKKKSRQKMGESVDVEDDDKTKATLDEILTALVKPGPDLVICDEGHRIKNSHASISQALKQIRSKRRIVLTGYPLQNNLLEYWCMVDFVRPNYLGTKTEFCNMFERPIQNGQCYDSTPQDIRLMRYRAHVLHSLLEGFVQRRSHQVLQVSLPQKEEYVLLLRMTEFQRKLYDTFMNEVVRTKAVPNPLKAFAVCCKIWNHPDVLFNFLKKRAGGEAVDLDLEETADAAAAKTPGAGVTPAATGKGAAARRGRGRSPRATAASKREKKVPFANSSQNKPAATITPNSSTLAPEATPNQTPLPGMSTMPNQPGGGMHPNYGMISQNQGYNSQGQPYDMGFSGQSSGNQFPGQFGPNTGPPGSYNPDGSSYMGFGAGDPSAYSECGSGQGFGVGPGSSYPYSSSSSQNQFGGYFGNQGGGNRGPSEFSDSTNQSGNNYWHGNQSFYQGSGNNNQGPPNYQQQSSSSFEQGSSAMQSGPGGNYQANPGTQSGGSYTQNPNPASQMGGDFAANTVGQGGTGYQQPPSGSGGPSSTTGYPQMPGGYGNQSQGGDSFPSGQVNPSANQYYEGGSGYGGGYFMGQGQNYGYGGNVPGQDPYNMGQSGYTGQQKLEPTQSTMGSHSSVPDATMQNQNAMMNPQGQMQNPMGGQGSNQNPMMNSQGQMQNPSGTQGSGQNAMMNPQGQMQNPMGVQGSSQNPMISPQGQMQNTSGTQGPGQNAMMNPQGQMQNPMGVQGSSQNPMMNPQGQIQNTSGTQGPSQNAMMNQQGQMQNPMGTQGSGQNAMMTQQGQMQNPMGTQGSGQNAMMNQQGQMQNPMGTQGSGQNAINQQGQMQNPMGTQGSGQNAMMNTQGQMQNTVGAQNSMGPSQNPLSSPPNQVQINSNAMGPEGAMGAHPNRQSSMVAQNQPPQGHGSSMELKNLLEAPQNMMPNPQNPSSSPQNGAMGSSAMTPDGMQGRNVNVHNSMAPPQVGTGVDSRAYPYSQPGMGAYPHMAPGGSRQRQAHTSNFQGSTGYGPPGGLDETKFSNPNVKIEPVMGMDCGDSSSLYQSGNSQGFGHMGSESNSWNSEFGNLKLEDNKDKDSKNFMDYSDNMGMRSDVKIEKMDYPKSALDSLKEEFSLEKDLGLSKLGSDVSLQKCTGVVNPNSQNFKMEEISASKEGDAAVACVGTKAEPDVKVATPGQDALINPGFECTDVKQGASMADGGRNVATSTSSPQEDEEMKWKEPGGSHADKGTSAFGSFQDKTTSTTGEQEGGVPGAGACTNTDRGDQLGAEGVAKGTEKSADGRTLDIATVKSTGREDPGIPYDWAVELLKNYMTGNIENSAKMTVFFCILEESMSLGDRILVFSQSLFTLNLIEDFLQCNCLPGREEKWARNVNYYRLDGSTAALEREKLINEYNSNPNIHLFLVSTRAGSLGINLVGANRVVVFDASWNPCHDTQAVCRVYRYGQKKPCFVYRLVMDNCLEKKIYDRQINKQGMADRVVDECNPDAHLSIKEVTNLCWDDEKDSEVQDFSATKDKYIDVVVQRVLDKHSKHLSKEPFQHESLLIDRKEKKLSQAEKRLAQRSYELEKQANIHHTRPYYPAAGGTGVQPGLHIRAIRTDGGVGVMPKPVASVRPMQSELGMERGPGGSLRSTVTTVNTGRTRWIPAEVWQRQGMSAQEMTLPLDVVIPTNSADRASIVLKAGQRVMVLKSPKGIYMQLENGKIIAIRTAFKVGGAGKGAGAQDAKTDMKTASFLSGDKSDDAKLDMKKEGSITVTRSPKVSNVLPLRNNPAITIIPKNSPSTVPRGIIPTRQIKQESLIKPWGSGLPQANKVGMARQKMLGKILQPTGEAKPYFHQKTPPDVKPAVAGNQPTGTAKPFFHESEGSNDNSTGQSSRRSDDGSVSGESNLATRLGEDKDVPGIADNENTKSSVSSGGANDFARNLEEMDLDSEMSFDDLADGRKEGGEARDFRQGAGAFGSEAAKFGSDVGGFQGETGRGPSPHDPTKPFQKERNLREDEGELPPSEANSTFRPHSSKYQPMEGGDFLSEIGGFQTDVQKMEASLDRMQPDQKHFQQTEGRFQTEMGKFQQGAGKYQQDLGKFQQDHGSKFGMETVKPQVGTMKFRMERTFQKCGLPIPPSSQPWQQQQQQKNIQSDSSFQPSHRQVAQSDSSFQQGHRQGAQSDSSFQPGHLQGAQSDSSFQPGHRQGAQSDSSFQQGHHQGAQSDSSFQPGHRQGAQSDSSFPPGHRQGAQSDSSFQPGHRQGTQSDSSFQPGLHQGAQSDSSFQPGLRQGAQSDSSFQQGHRQGAQSDSSFQPGHHQGAQSDSSFQPGHRQGAQSDSSFQPGHRQGAQSDNSFQQGHRQGAQSDSGFQQGHRQGTQLPQQGTSYPNRPNYLSTDFSQQHQQHQGMQNPQSRVPDPKSPMVLDSSDDDKKPREMLSPPSEILSPPSEMLSPPSHSNKSALKSYRHNFGHSLGGSGVMKPQETLPDVAKEPEVPKPELDPSSAKPDLFPVQVPPAKPPRSQTNYVPNLTPRNPAAKKARTPKSANKTAPMNYQSFGSDQSPEVPTPPKPTQPENPPLLSSTMQPSSIERPYPMDPMAPYQHPHYGQHFGTPGYGYGFGNSYYGEGQYPPYQMPQANVPPPHQNLQSSLPPSHQPLGGSIPPSQQNPHLNVPTQHQGTLPSAAQPHQGASSSYQQHAEKLAMPHASVESQDRSQPGQPSHLPHLQHEKLQEKTSVSHSPTSRLPLPELPQYGLGDKNLHLGLSEHRTEDERTAKPSRKDSAESHLPATSEAKKDVKATTKEDRSVLSPEGGSQAGNNSARSTPSTNPPTTSATGQNVLDSVPQYTSALPGNYPPYPPAGGSIPPHQSPYDMMMNTYPPHQYNLPGNAAPSPYRPQVPNPYPAGGYPMGYGAGNNYDADYARASMYSAFHRPEPHHFPPGDPLSSPFLPANNSSPFLPPHHRFPTPNPPQNPNYYPQNMYAPPYGARPAYGAADPAYNPYSSAPGFSPFLNPHLAPPIHQGYPGIPPTTPAQSSPAPPPQ